MTCINPYHLSLSTQADLYEEQISLDTPVALTPPSLLPPSSEYQLLSTIDALCDIKNRLMMTQADRLLAIKEELSRASDAFIRRLQEICEGLKSSEQWHSLKKVSTSLLSALSLIAGLGAMATPSTALIGGALITAGILSIGNIAMTECKGWHQVAKTLSMGNAHTEKQLQHFLPIVSGILAAGCSVAGSTYALTSNGLSLASQASQIAQAAFNLFHTATTFEKGASDANVHFSQAQLATEETTLHTTQTSLEMLNQHFETLSCHFEHLMRQAKRSVQAIIQTHHLPL